MRIFTLLNELPAASRKYQFAIALAENIIDENVRDGHETLQEINRTSLSTTFAQTANLLHQSLQDIHQVKDTDTWSSRIPYSLPLGSYIGLSLKGLQFLTSLLPLGSKDPGRDGSGDEAYESVKSEKYAQELLWIRKKLKYCGAIDEAIVQWSFSSGLAWLSMTANHRVQSTIVLISGQKPATL